MLISIPQICTGTIAVGRNSYQCVEVNKIATPFLSTRTKKSTAYAVLFILEMLPHRGCFQILYKRSFLCYTKFRKAVGT